MTLAEQAGLTQPSVIVRRLDGPGPSVEIAPDELLSPASMIKVPVAAALAILWEDGTLRKDARVTIRAADMTANDCPSPFVPGYEASLEELAGRMLTRSDNVATNTLIGVVGRARANTLIEGLGLRATAVRRKLSGSLPLIADPEATGRNAHPASDAARLFEAIALQRFPGTAWLYDTLSRQEWNDKLSPGLLEGDRFAHKTGDHDEASHDGGILELAGGGRYVLVVYTTLPASPESDRRLTRFMRGLRPLL